MKDYLKNKIIEYVDINSEDYFDFLDGNGYKKPLIRFVSAKDSIFNDFKEIIGDFHLTPKELYEFCYGKDSFDDGSVISIALPYSDEVIESNKNREWPSKKWTLMRTFGMEDFGFKLADYVKDILNQKGYNCIDPVSQETYGKLATDTGPSSNWSQRHIAYATGMGTFSLNAGFITEKGIAVIFLSLVTDLVVESDERTALNHTANCLFYHKGKCKKCVKKCPANALSENGIDKLKCFNMGYGEKAQEYAKSVGAKPELGSGCGLCQVGVPCESQNPTKPKIK